MTQCVWNDVINQNSLRSKFASRKLLNSIASKTQLAVDSTSLWHSKVCEYKIEGINLHLNKNQVDIIHVLQIFKKIDLIYFFNELLWRCSNKPWSQLTLSRNLEGAVSSHNNFCSLKKLIQAFRWMLPVPLIPLQNGWILISRHFSLNSVGVLYFIKAAHKKK